MAKYFDIEVSLVGVEPRIWRRFLIAGSSTFEDLHCAIQQACGWEFAHLYEFRHAKGRNCIARTAYDDPFADEAAPSTSEVKLAAKLGKKGATCLYVYDFGDNWEHVVEVKDVVDLPEKFRCRLVDGARAFPLEDCGDVWGYYGCCAAVGAMAPKEIGVDKEELADLREWVGQTGWSPDEFDLTEARKCFDS